MRILFLFVLALAICLPPVAQSQPFYYAGVVGDALLQNQAWIWNDQHLYHHQAALPAQEILADSVSITGIRGLIPSDVVAGYCWFWTSDKAYVIPANMTPAEVQMPGGGSISGVRGCLYDEGSGNAAWFWSAANIYHIAGSPVSEVLDSSSAAITNVVGMATASFNPGYCWIWTPQHVYLREGSTTTEVLDPSNQPLTTITSVVNDFITAGANGWLWNDQHIYYRTGTSTTEVLDSSGAAISGVQGVVNGNQANLCYIWTSSKLYRRQGNITTEIKDQSGNSVAGIKGLVNEYISLTKAWVWTSNNIYSLQGLLLVKVLENSTSISGVQGLMNDYNLNHCWFWTQTKLYDCQGVAATELRAPDSSSISGIRGMYNDVVAGAAWVWTASNVYRVSGLIMTEFTAPGGAPLSNTWSVTHSPGPVLSAWVRTFTNTYYISAGNVSEILTQSGGSISSPTQPMQAMIGDYDSWAAGTSPYLHYPVFFAGVVSGSVDYPLAVGGTDFVTAVTIASGNTFVSGPAATSLYGHAGVLIGLGQTVGVGDDGTSKPQRFTLYQNFPNPFNPVTEIWYSLHEDVHVKLLVYDILGRQVATLADRYEAAGNKSVQFDGSNRPSGVYFYRLIAGSFVETKKLILLK